MDYTDKDVSYLLSPKAIREKANKIFDLAQNGKTNFKVNLDKLESVSKFVLEVIKENYPSLEIPYHSRWGHFKVGGVDRLGLLEEKLQGLSQEDKARAKLDLVITSVLLDAGAGPDWKYNENGTTFNRSEGLGVASFHMFLNGDFSSSKGNPFQADAEGLKNLTPDKLKSAFQVSEDNPLVGVEGRVKLLNSLGEAIEKDQKHFGQSPARPGNLFNLFENKQSFEAEEILLAVLKGLGKIWPGRINLGDTNLGDVWKHPLLGEQNNVECLIPFHKLSQWLTYSMIEVFEESGKDVLNLDGLTGLAEYRNGGLILDKELVSLRDPAMMEKGHTPDSEIIIEWRALTLVLIEKMAEVIRKELGKSQEEFPLAKVLEGGTWWAGRKAANALRSDGTPPLKIISDGTVF